MSDELYEDSGPGPYEPAELNKFYRAIKLQSGGAASGAVDLVVNSRFGTASVPDQPLHLELGELHTGNTVIKSGTVTGVIGYLP